MNSSTATTHRSEHKVPASNIVQGVRNTVLRIAAYIQESRRSREPIWPCVISTIIC